MLNRAEGEFFTPLVYAKLAHDYLAKAIPDRYNGNYNHHSIYDDYNWYDPCAGLGNLTYHCPSDMKGELFISTLNQKDIDICNSSGQNPHAHMFQYDFLNQSDEEFPIELRNKLIPGSKWVFIMNPPFAAGTGDKFSNSGESSRSNVAFTNINDEMQKNTMGIALQNTLTQFMYRVVVMANKYDIDITLALFGTSAFVNGSGFKNFRKLWNEQFNFINGFAFHCSAFEGVTGEWPVIFTIWGNTSKIFQPVCVDIIENQQKIGNKYFQSVEKPLSTWVNRPKPTTVVPPMDGVNIVTSKKISCDKLSKNALGYLRFHSNTVQNGRVCYLTSSCNYDGHGWSITEQNFEDSLVCLGVRRIISPNWLNNKDEYSIPNINHVDYKQFKNDMIVWTLFNGANKSASLGNVEYKDRIYNIKNEFFWLTKEELMEIKDMPTDIINQAKTRFVAQWLKDKTFSKDIQELLKLGKELVELSAWARPYTDIEYQLVRFDAGLHQIKSGLFGKNVKFQKTQEMIEAIKQFNQKYKEITARLKPYIYKLDFLKSPL